MADPTKRLNYFDHQFLREKDFNDEQGYHVQNQRDHARLLHTPGIAEGLTIPDPPAGATAVTVNAGVAFDDQGRRIVLADNYPLELADLPADETVYVTIAYAEVQTDPTDETGITGNTRWTEAPLIETAASAPANPNEKLVLARIERSGTAIGTVDRSERRTAGVKGGDLDVRTLTLTSESIAPSGWVQTKLGESGRADVGGTLRVTGDLIVSGSIQGDIAVNTVETGDLVDNAVTSAKLAEADGSSGQDANTGSGVKTGHIQDGAVTNAKLANNAVNAAKIVDGSVGTAELTDGAVTLQKLAPAVRPIVSIDGVSNPGGNVDLIQTGAITITPDDTNNRITLGENHSARTDNPHNTTAAQVGALPSAGGAVSGALRVNGNLGVNTSAVHRLQVSAGDEPDNQTYGVVVSASTGASATVTTACSANASNNDGSGPVYGFDLSAYGSGSGAKFGVTSSVSGEGGKYAGQFLANTSTTTSGAQTQALYAYASSAGTGNTYGLQCYAGGNGTGPKYGLIASVSGEGTKYAGQFNASTTSDTSSAHTEALYAYASNAGTGTTYGARVYSTASSSSNNSVTRGLYVYASNAGTSTTYGMYCAALGAGTGVKYGLYSSVSGGGTTQYAGYFNGNVHVSGNLSASGSKPFLIDHPGDPRNQTLRHSAVESPEELCMYRGKAALNAQGSATVTMPAYFAALTKEEEATVALTAIGKKPFLTSYEWNKKFTAFTVHGEPGAEVSYIVLANRDDPAIHLLRRPVEEKKGKAEKGKFIFPEAYGEPPEKGIAPPSVEAARAEAPPGPSEKELRQLEADVTKQEKALEQERERMEREHKEQEQLHKRMLEEHERHEQRRRQKEAAFLAGEPKPGGSKP